MIRRILAALLAVLGVTAIVLAVMSATTWRDEEELTATLPERPGAPILLTEPGVLDMAADTVTITLTADDGEDIWMSIVPTERVMEWIGDGSRTAVTGLASRTELAGRMDGTEDSVPHPAESDLFLDPQTGTGELTLEWGDEPGRWSLFAVTDGTAPAPTITLTWPQAVSTPYLVPGLIAGGVALLLALALLLWPRRDVVEDDAEPEPADVPVVPALMPHDEAAAHAVGGDYAAAPAAGRAGVDPYASMLAARDDEANDPTGRADVSDPADPADPAEPDLRAGDREAAPSTGPGDDTESIPVVDTADVSAEAVDAALSRDMAELAERERAGQTLRRYERRVLAEARRETYDDLRAGVDTEVRGYLRSAGSARGAGILPYSPRADELRAEAMEHTEPDLTGGDAWGETAEIDGRPLSRRERRALERRDHLSADDDDTAFDDGSGATQLAGATDVTDLSRAAGSPDGAATSAASTTAPTTDTERAAPSRPSDDEWRDLWGFGPSDAHDPEAKR